MKVWIKKLINEKKIVYQFTAKLYHAIIISLFYSLRIFRVKSSKIVFCSYYGKGYSDNPKYIAEEIIAQKLEYDMVWLLKKDLMKKNNLPKGIRPVEYGSLRSIYELVTAKIWIDNSRKLFYTRKRKKQFYLQTWHGILPLKKIEKDAANSLSKGYILSAQNDSKMTDLMLTGISRNIERFRNTFWYRGQIMNIGIPKLDLYFKDTSYIDQKVRSKIGISDKKRIILYCPTFRKDNKIDIYNLNYETCLKLFSEKFGEEWILLVRLHPNVSNQAKNMRLYTNVIDVTQYDDIQELVCISEIMITDYSGLMFEFAVRKKPCFIYAPDFTDYIKDRGLNYSFDELPFPISTTNIELEENVARFDLKEYSGKIQEFWDSVGIMQKATVSDKVVERIKQEMKYKE